jgi:hypothetical protein
MLRVMSFLDLVHRSSTAAAAHTADSSEHEAVVDLVVLAAFADGTISEAELQALEQLDLDHAHWDQGEFSVIQYLPVAIAKARRAHEDAAINELLEDVSRRITTRPLRVEALRYCVVEVADGGVTQDETRFIAQARRALA